MKTNKHTSKEYKHLIFGNYGNNTIALIQWAYDVSLSSVAVVSIDTKWGSPQWQSRVEEGEKLSKNYGFQTYRLQSIASFQDLVIQRQAFPSKRYPWCTFFLKGMTLNSWLDENDITLNTVILLPKRRADSRKNIHLIEFVENSEYYGGRKLWHPLYNTDDEIRNDLILKSGITILDHRSLECYPCIHSTDRDFKKIDEKTIERVSKLEEKIGKTMFLDPEETTQLNFRSLVRGNKNLALISKLAIATDDHNCDTNWVCGN